ncbi:MAG TPA: hypothetical protein PK500_03445 [Candidatus Egerieousia sp.]|nr:hypothetical protein [Candidatus Egerieousia sp.]
MKEYYAGFEKQIAKYLVEHSNEKIMPYNVLAKNMDAIAIELLIDDGFAIVTAEHISEDQHKSFEFLKSEKSILDIIALLKYFEQEGLITYFFFNKDEIESEKPRQIYDKDKYIYHEKLNTGEVIKDPTFEELKRALSAGRYSSVKEENGQMVEEFYAETRLQSKFYISDFVKGHFGSFIFVSPMLVELVKNKFLTPVQVRFKRQQIVSWVAIGLAFFSSLAAMIVQLCSNHC